MHCPRKEAGSCGLRSIVLQHVLALGLVTMLTSLLVTQPGDEADATVQDRPGEGAGDGQGRREGETGAGAGFEVEYTEGQVAF